MQYLVYSSEVPSDGTGSTVINVLLLHSTREMNNVMAKISGMSRKTVKWTICFGTVGDENECHFSEQKGPKPKQRFDLVTEDHLFPRLLNKKCLITTETETGKTTQKSLISRLPRKNDIKALYLPDLITYQTGGFINGNKARTSWPKTGKDMCCLFSRCFQSNDRANRLELTFLSFFSRLPGINGKWLRMRYTYRYNT